MQRTQSPALRPSDNGACRWQHLLSSATTFPSEVRKKRIEWLSSVRWKSESPPTSCDHAATYQTLRRNFPVCTRHPLSLSEHVRGPGDNQESTDSSSRRKPG